MKDNSIQGLRGICALVVFFSHALNIPIIPISSIKESPLHLFFDGQISVMIFLAISGFFYGSPSSTSMKSYFIGLYKKTLRIWPAYLLAMIIGWLICNMHLSYNSMLFTEWGNSFWGGGMFRLLNY